MNEQLQKNKMTIHTLSSIKNINNMKYKILKQK